MADFISWETKENEKNEASEKIEIEQDTSKVQENNLSLSENEKDTLDKLIVDFKEKNSNLFGSCGGGIYFAHDDDAQSAARIAGVKVEDVYMADTSVEIGEDVITFGRISSLINDDKTSEVVKYLLLYLYNGWRNEESKRLLVEQTNSRLGESYKIISELLRNKRDGDKFVKEIENILMTLKKAV